MKGHVQDIAERLLPEVKRIEAGPDGGIRLDLVGLVKFPIGYCGVRHTHGFWEILFICNGKGRVESAGWACALTLDDVVLVRPGLEHRLAAEPAWPLEVLYVGFTFDPQAGLPAPAQPVLLGDGEGPEGIRAELRSLLPLVRRCGDTGELKAMMPRFLPAAVRALGLVSDRLLAVPRTPADPYDALIHSVKEELVAKLALPMSVVELARRSRLSPAYFGEVFRRLTGLGIKEYHRNLRLLRSLDFIRNTDRPISAIAVEVGMGDLAYFSRAFKRRFGMSPSQARRGAGREET